MLFARPGEYKPCGIFSLEHFGLIAVTIVCIAIAIKNTYDIMPLGKESIRFKGQKE